MFVILRQHWKTNFRGKVSALPNTVPITFDIFFIVCLFPALIVGGASHGRTSNRKILSILGELSYPLYITHWPILLLVKYVFLSRIGATMTVVAGCIAATAVAWITYFMIDKPARKWLMKRLVIRSIPHLALPPKAELES